MRSALLLPARTTYHDSDFARRTREEIRSESLKSDAAAADRKSTRLNSSHVPYTTLFRSGEEMIAKTVCRHAVKANDPLRYLEVEKLIQDLLECDLPYCCPHGRPTMIQISLAELEKKFGRKV